MTTTTTTISRTAYALMILSMTLTEWFVTQFNPAANGVYWLCGAVGSLALRLLFPKTPLLQSFSGWFIGFAFACLTSKTALKNGWFWAWEPELVWGALGFIGDLGLQVVATLYRILEKILGYAEANPGDAFDEGMTKSERFFALFVRIKAPLLDLIGLFSAKNPTNLP